MRVIGFKRLPQADDPLSYSPFTSHKTLKNDDTMAVTPSKDQKRRDREQKKKEKRLAREHAKIEKLSAEKAASQEAEEAAALEAFCKTEEGIKAKEEADFEAELAAEAAGK